MSWPGPVFVLESAGSLPLRTSTPLPLRLLESSPYFGRSSMPASVPHTSFDSYIAANDEWQVNGRRATRSQRDRMLAAFRSHDSFPPRETPTQCGFCRTRMETPNFRRENPELEEWHVDRIYSLAHCPYCCHWKFWASESTNKCMDAPTNVVAESVARKFDKPLPEGCATELAIQLRQNCSLWHSIDPRRMERFVADLFRANYQHVEVIHVGKPGKGRKDMQKEEGRKKEEKGRKGRREEGKKGHAMQIGNAWSRGLFAEPTHQHPRNRL